MKAAILFLIIFQFGHIGFAQQQPKLVLPVGHTGEILSAQFSLDGKIIVTTSADNTAKIWDVASGKLLHELIGFTSMVRLAQFSPDGKRIVTVSGENTIKIWDAASNQILHEIIGHWDYVKSVQFSLDGKHMITVSYESIKIWDVATGRNLQDLEGHTDWVKSGNFSFDGNRIVTCSYDKTVKIWDAATGRLLYDLAGNTGDVNSAYFSPDGKSIVTSSWDNTAKIWDAYTGQLLFVLAGHTGNVNDAKFSPDGKFVITSSWDNTAKIWDVSTGLLLNDLIRHIGNVNDAKFSPNGKFVITSSWDNTAKIWDVSTGLILLDLKEHSNSITAQFSPDGKRIIITSGDNTIKIWDIISGKVIRELRGNTVDVNYAEFSPDSKSIAIAAGDKTAKICDVASGRLLHELAGHTGNVNDARFSPDGKSIVTSSWDNTAKIWDVSSGKLLINLSGHTNGVSLAQFSSDGKNIVTSSWDNTAKIWDVSSGNILQDLKGHSSFVMSKISPNGKSLLTTSWDRTSKIWDFYSGSMLYDLTKRAGSIKTAEFSFDGKSIVIASGDNTIKIMDVASGRMVHEFTNVLEHLNNAQFSPDGLTIISVSNDINVKIWNILSNNILWDLNGHTEKVSSIQFSPDGKWMATSSQDNTAKIWDFASGKLLHDLNGHSGPIKSFQFSFDGKSIATTSIDSKTILWDASSGKILYTRLQLTNNDWLIYDEDYRYDGSPGARDYLYFVCGNEIIDLAQMKDALYVPGLGEKIMNKEEINYPKLSELDICEALPIVERIVNDQFTYSFKITQRKLKLQYVEVYVNDKRVYTIPMTELKALGNDYFLDLPEDKITRHFIEGSDNKVHVLGIVLSPQGNELKSRGEELIFSPEEKKPGNPPKLYAVMVGVNEYKDPSLKLNYPAKDAIDLGSALEASAAKLIGKENVFLYLIHTGVKSNNGFTTPEKEGIKKALEDIGKKANPEDIILLFFAGHGVMQGTEEKLFTFLTAEASKINPTGINTKELQQWLSYEGPYKILANKAILIFDACNSGQATQELLALARNDDNTRRIRQVEDLKDKSGMFILAASAPNQSAYELPQYEQGLLTYSLLSVIKNNPDILDGGQFLNVQKWFLETEKFLKQLVTSQGYQQDAQPFGTANIRIGIVDEEVRNDIILAKEKPVILCANVLNSESFNDDLQLKNLINQKLADISERGTGSQIIFVNTEIPGANKINIIYDLISDQINCKVRLLKEGETLYQGEVKGIKADLNDLALRIIETVVDFVR
jgi:WD40 repeat protein